LFAPKIETAVVPFDRIIPEVLAGKYEAGLIIHEGQLTYERSGLKRILDLGRWWHEQTGLPLPLGGNAIRRELGPELIAQVTKALRDSIQYALDHREPALAYAMQFARDLDPQMADRFVGMYVNNRTLDYGEDGKQAVKTFGNGIQSRLYSTQASRGVCVGSTLQKAKDAGQKPASFCSD